MIMMVQRRRSRLPALQVPEKGRYGLHIILPAAMLFMEHSSAEARLWFRSRLGLPLARDMVLAK